MRRSEDRILTTHTGSLPRPPELTRLYVRRARGESVDAPELEKLRRLMAAPDACRRVALPGLQTNDGAATRRQTGRQQHGSAQGDR